MGQALELAKNKLKLDKTNQPAEKTSEKTEETIDDILTALDKEDFTEAKRTTLKLRVAEMRARIRDLENRPGNTTQNGEPKLDRQAEIALEVRREIAADARAMLDEGIDSNTVAKYLQSALSSTVRTPGLTGPVTVGDIPQLIKSIAESLSPSKNGGGDPEIKELLRKISDNSEKERLQFLKDIVAENRNANKALLEEIKLMRTDTKTVGENKKSVKVKIIKPDWTVVDLEEGEPIIITQPSGSSDEPLESIKEKNRHVEKMKEIEIDAEDKKEKRDILGELPERIGMGLAHRSLEEAAKEDESTSDSGDLKYFKCKNKDCNKQIPYTPGSLVVICPHCGEKHSREVKNEGGADAANRKEA
jgi:hypothetical protein